VVFALVVVAAVLLFAARSALAGRSIFDLRRLTVEPAPR
jgi:hypothetical protein